MRRDKQPRSYHIQIESGNILRRNWRDIIKTKEKLFKVIQNISDDDNTEDEIAERATKPTNEYSTWCRKCG